MEFTHRTVLRHAAVFAALLALPFVAMQVADALLWFRVHAVYFAVLALAGTLTGWLAHTAKQQGLPAAWIASADTRPVDLSYVHRLCLQWARCSRCVAYWSAAALIGILSLLFWPIEGHSLWAIVLRTMYFAAMAGSLAGAVAVSLQLFDRPSGS